jgi:predicted ATPase/class 3 adenylate cyclase
LQRPTGTITFLFTDIEGSTRLWEERPDAMRESLARHDALLRSAIENHDGFVFKTVGDSFCAAFANAPDALAAAVTAQRSLNSAPGEVDLKVRMALHAGAADERDGDYFGPTLNRVARLLAAGHGGQVLLSQAAREALPSDAPLSDMGSHRLKDLQQPERVYQLRIPDLPSEFPPLRTLGNTNLPIQLTSFIGREAEIRDVRNLLSTARLVTLLGTGGIGKTRLSLQVAAEMTEEFPDGVWLVELASLTEPGLVSKAVASELGVADEPGRPLTETLADYLRSKTLLLILDNCEHLIAACASLAGALVRACPGVKILASSREPLNIPEERPWRIPSLLPPDPDRLPTREAELIAAVASSDAVRLFVERATIQRPDFRLDARNARAVAGICCRLDGIPLALELAAARVKAMTVEQIAVRLDDCFRLLTAGSRTALPRQQTLRALLDWSYDLLNSQERALLHRVSVFAGGWTLEAAESVCSGETIKDWDVVDLLASLVDKSLILFEEPDGNGRYRLLETVRQYGREKQADEEQGDILRSRHAAFFLALAEEANEKLMGPEQAAWADRLETEHDNLRAALDWYVKAPEDALPGLRLSGALQRFWWVRGHMTEGRQRYAAVLANDASAEPTAERALALQGAGNLAFQQSDLNEADRCYQQVLEIRGAIGDRPGTAGPLASLGNVAHYQGDYPRARSLFEEALVINRETGNRLWEAACLACL